MESPTPPLPYHLAHFRRKLLYFPRLLCPPWLLSAPELVEYSWRLLCPLSDYASDEGGLYMHRLWWPLKPVEALRLALIKRSRQGFAHALRWCRARTRADREFADMDALGLGWLGGWLGHKHGARLPSGRTGRPQHPSYWVTRPIARRRQRSRVAIRP